MDHSWGRTVHDVGLGDTGATLAARFLPLPGRMYLTNAPSPPGFCQFWYCPLDTELLVNFWGGYLLAGAEHFPYGWDVPPDEPL